MTTATEIKMNAEEIAERTYVCIEPRKDNCNYFTVPFLDLQLYLRVFLNDEQSFRMPKNLHDPVIFNSALEKTQEEFFEEQTWFGELTIVTSHKGMFGASALAFPEVFKKYCEKNDLKRLYIIPSSIHELILQPTDIAGIGAVNHMIQETNQDVLEPEDVLSDHVYIYDYERNEVTC